MSSVPVRFSVLSLRRRPLARALAHGLLLTSVAAAGTASAQSAPAEEEGRTTSQTLQTVQREQLLAMATRARQLQKTEAVHAVVNACIELAKVRNA